MNARVWLAAVLPLLLPGMLAAQDAPKPAETAKLVPALGWDSATQGAFVTSAAVDAQNNVWAGTEGNGLWRYDSRGKKWTQFTTKDGLGDDCIYALAVDKQGRVWAGHLNHGASVWNGAKWKNYGLIDGPLGDRVFSIAVCPTDGDVWIATDCGAARYSIAKDDWDYYTCASGLPSNQIQSIAFNSKGDIILGTQCDGIAMATAADGYKKWRTTAGSLYMPNAAVGEGLASGLINQVSVIQLDGDEGVAVSTPVAMSVTPDGKQWMFIHGEDWQQNVKGLYDTPPPPPHPHPEEIAAGTPLLVEDWVTCISQDEKTKDVWIGHRVKGLEVRNGKEGNLITKPGSDSDSFFVRAICLPQKGPPLVAVCDIAAGGLLTLDNPKTELEPGDEPPKTAPPLPGTPKPADADTLTALTKQLDVFKNQLKPCDAVFLGDDWRTGGDWVGRYGSSYAMLCGQGPDAVFQMQPGFDASVSLGPHNKGAAAPDAYVAKDISDDMRVLYNPATGHRVEAELNDVSYTKADYPLEWEGPDLWVDVKVPEGIHCVTLYFTNNDSQDSKGDAENKLRDYDVQVLPWADDKETVQRSAPLARARVTDFHGGVYKMFAVAGPARYIVRVGRNHSFVTKLQGVFIDQLMPIPTDVEKSLPGFDTAEYDAPDPVDKAVIERDALLAAANGLWDLLDQSFDKRGAAGLQIPLRIVAYRAAAAAKAPDALLQRWRWQMGIWTKEDRDAFDKAMAAAFKAYSAGKPAANENDQ